MEDKDRELIKKVLKSNAKLRRLYQQHQEFEEKLAGFQNRPYLTATEEVHEKQLKFLKLQGVDAMMEIVAPHKAEMSL